MRKMLDTALSVTVGFVYKLLKNQVNDLFFIFSLQNNGDSAGFAGEGEETDEDVSGEEVSSLFTL